MAVPRMYVYFDKELRPGPLAEADWFVRIDSRRRILTNAESNPDRVQIDTAPGPFDAGPDRVRYDAVVIKLRDVDGLEVAPFFLPVVRT